eukprot:6488384-Amphidinium_carterae.1
MTPVRCGARTRPSPTHPELESCSARWASRQSATGNQVHSVHSSWSLGLPIIGGALALILACWSCSRKLLGVVTHVRSTQIELPDVLQPLAPNSDCLSPVQKPAWSSNTCSSLACE